MITWTDPGEWCEPDDCPASVCGGPHVTIVVDGNEITGLPDIVYEFADKIHPGKVPEEQ